MDQNRSYSAAVFLSLYCYIYIRINGSHHIYGRTGLSEQISFQNVGGRAKPYQVRQFLKISLLSKINGSISAPAGAELMIERGLHCTKRAEVERLSGETNGVGSLFPIRDGFADSE